MANKVSPNKTVTVNTGGLSGPQEISARDLEAFQQNTFVADQLLTDTTLLKTQPMSKQDARKIKFTTTCPFKLFSKTKKVVVDEHCRLVLWRLGRILHAKPLGPGRLKYYPAIDNYTIIKIQLDTLNLNELELMTKDMYGINASFQVFFHVVDVIKAVVNIKDYRFSLDLICRSKLRDVIGKMTSDDLKRPFPKSIMEQLLAKINQVTYFWGIVVDSIDRTGVKMKTRIDYAVPILVY